MHTKKTVPNICLYQVISQFRCIEFYEVETDLLSKQPCFGIVKVETVQFNP